MVMNMAISLAIPHLSLRYIALPALQAVHGMRGLMNQSGIRICFRRVRILSGSLLIMKAFRKLLKWSGNSVVTLLLFLCLNNMRHILFLTILFLASSSAAKLYQVGRSEEHTSELQSH